MRHAIYSFNLFILVFSMAAVNLSANAPDRIFIEKRLRETRAFLKFINKGVSNFDAEESREELKEAAEIQYQAHKDYLAGKFNDSFHKIRKCHKKLRLLYRHILGDIYIVDAENLLEKNSPKIVLARDKFASHLLKIGFHNLRRAQQEFTEGKNTNRFLYSSQIRIYRAGIKFARQAKRYGLLALVESQIPLEEKSEFEKVSLDQALGESLPERKPREYVRVKNKLKNMISRRLLNNNYNFFVHHNDNYGYIPGNKENVLETLTVDITSSELEPQ